MNIIKFVTQLIYICIVHTSNHNQLQHSIDYSLTTKQHTWTRTINTCFLIQKDHTTVCQRII